MTRCGQKPGRNLAAQQAPNLILASPLCCHPGWGQRMRSNRLKRREIITLLGGAAAAWPLAAKAQQSAVPAIGWLSPGSPERDELRLAAFERSLQESSY